MPHFDNIMTAGYRRVIRPHIFRKTHDDPEVAHEWVLNTLERCSNSQRLLRLLRSIFRPVNAPVDVLGMRFPNRVGLAAGYDKNAVALPAWEALGFGFCVIGTVTREVQAGNPRPRQFRLVEDEALVNRMGFNNDGAATICQRLRACPKLGIPIWVSIGKSAITKLEDAPIEYYELTRAVFPFADVIEVNVTSPNTPGLRTLLDTKPLNDILRAVQAGNLEKAADGQTKPVVLKLSPDSQPDELDTQIEAALSHGINGFTATNTSTGRLDFSLKSPEIPETGGLSGEPLFDASIAVVKHVARNVNGLTPIIAAGGISAADDVRQMIDAGASLVQIFTALVYEGPFVVRTLARALAQYEPI